MQPGAATSPSTVFISYAREDQRPADQLMAQLADRDVDCVNMPSDRTFEKAYRNRLLHGLESSDAWLLLISSDSLTSEWVNSEVDIALERRGVDVVPVLLQPNINLPDWLSNIGAIRAYEDSGMQQLANRLQLGFQLAELADLDGRRLEQLVADLLPRLGYEILPAEASPDSRVDFTVKVHDPLGIAPSDIVAYIEVKAAGAANRGQRVSVNQIAAFASLVASLPGQAVGVLITNGQLTSVAHAAVLDLGSREGSRPVRIIDRPGLRKLLLQHPDLARKHGLSTAAMS